MSIILLLLAALPLSAAEKAPRHGWVALARMSELVVLGEVEGVKGGAAKFAVESVLKASTEPARSVVSPLSVLGGVDAPPHFKSGERAVLFLVAGSSGSFRVAGDGQGRAAVGERAASLAWARELVRVAGLKDEEAADRALLAAAAGTDPLPRGIAVEHLAMDIAFSTRAKAYVRPLTHLLASPDPEVRAAAASALRFLKSEEAEPTLIALTEDGDHRVVEAASLALGPYDSDASVAALVALTRHARPSVRLRAGEDLGRNSKRLEAKKALVRLLRDDSELVRRSAPRFLTSWIRDKDAEDFIDTVKELTTDRDPKVRATAADVLREFNDPRYR